MDPCQKLNKDKIKKSNKGFSNFKIYVEQCMYAAQKYDSLPIKQMYDKFSMKKTFWF